MKIDFSHQKLKLKVAKEVGYTYVLSNTNVKHYKRGVRSVESSIFPCQTSNPFFLKLGTDPR